MKILRLLFVFLVGAAASRADVKLPALFTDNVVLQRDKPIAVWGWADNDEKVTVEFLGHSVSAEPKDGKWKVLLAPGKAGGPHTLKVSGKNSISINNVLLGDVWVCSGQSNMEFPLRASFQSQKDMTNAANPRIRLFTVPKLKKNEPADDVSSKWEECTPETVPGFSAVAYYFGRELQAFVKVPIGLIHTSWGGSPAEVWLREELLEENPLYKTDILNSYITQTKHFQEESAKWDEEEAALKKEGKQMTRRRPTPGWKPSELYNGMIAPLVQYSITGAIWYQGESNAGRAYQYRTLFADMISNWRIDFGQGDFPFLLVQLAPWDKGKKRELAAITEKPGDSDWAELREAQLLATKILPNVGMAVITDVGDKDDIHPTKKEPVGYRLAMAARGIAYDQKITYSGPLYRELEIEGDKAIVSFDFVGKGLDAKGGKVQGFAIAGHDRKFYWADAVIKSNKVVVSSSQVPEPVAVRYGWADFPVVNLVNKDGLPASPFRTDNFPMITGPKR
jgi:sialate O-acetylesterase